MINKLHLLHIYYSVFLKISKARIELRYIPKIIPFIAGLYNILLMIPPLFFYWKRRTLTLVKNACLYIFVERRSGYDTTPTVSQLELGKYIRSLLVDQNRMDYVFLDEIQKVADIPNPYLPGSEETVSFANVLLGLWRSKTSTCMSQGAIPKCFPPISWPSFAGEGMKCAWILYAIGNPMTLTEMISAMRGGIILPTVGFRWSLGSKRYYIQSAFAIPDEEKRKQEIRPFTKIQDSFKKIVVVREDIEPWHDENGILYVGIEQFLLDASAMDL